MKKDFTIFISYSHHDEDNIRECIRKLLEHNADIWTNYPFILDSNNLSLIIYLTKKTHLQSLSAYFTKLKPSTKQYLERISDYLEGRSDYLRRKRTPLIINSLTKIILSAEGIYNEFLKIINLLIEYLYTDRTTLGTSKIIIYPELIYNSSSSKGFYKNQVNYIFGGSLPPGEICKEIYLIESDRTTLSAGEICNNIYLKNINSKRGVSNSNYLFLESNLT